MDDCYAQYPNDDPRARLLSTLAGPCATYYAFGRMDGSEFDMAAAKTMATDIEPAWAEVLGMIPMLWSSIEGLVPHLIEHGVLSGDEITNLLDHL